MGRVRSCLLAGTAILTALAGCLWRPKPYAGDPLVRTLRNHRTPPTCPSPESANSLPEPPLAPQK